MADDLPFKAEYAKSNRSSCKSCRDNIAKDSLRVAKMVQSPHFDGRIPNWFHFSCFFRKHKVKAFTDIAGFDSLRWEDQEKVKEKTGGGGGGGGGGKKGETPAVVENDVSDDLLAEYAKSSRSKCKNCTEQIDKGELRLAKVQEPDAESNAPAGVPIPWWHHVDCFVKSRESLSVDAAVTAESFSGFTKLKKEDKDLLKSKLGSGGKKKAKGGKRKAAAVDETDAKRKKTAEEDEIEIKLKEQSQLLWKVRDDLQKHCSLPELREMLEDNGMNTQGGESSLLNRCSDGMTFGRLLPCEECSDGQLVYRTEGYCCTGNLTAWTKCMFVTREPKRAKWKISDDLKEASDFLKNFKCKKRKRVFPQTTSSTVVSPKGIKLEGATSKIVTTPGKPLSGMTFAVIGRLQQSKGKLSAAIQDLGGSVVDKVNTSVDCCISSQAEVDKKSKKMCDAEKSNVPVVSEDYLEAVKKGGARLMIMQHSIVSWGKKDASVVDGGPVVVPVGKGSKVTKSALEGGPAKKMKVAVKGGAAVDPESEMEDTCHVLQENGNIYSATLGLVDIVRGANSYYKLQLLKDDKVKSYYLFRSWGRVGTHIGGNKLESCGSKANAIRSFLDLYGEKTGNSWEDRKNFVKHPNKFYPLEIDYGQDNEELKSSIAPGSKSVLAPAIQELIKMIFDVESMKKTLVEFEIDLKKMPLGKLTRRQIESAYAVLGEAQKLISDGGSSSSLLDASNRFYTLLPHDFGMKKPPLLDNLELIKTKVGMLDNLLDIEVAYSLLKSGEGDLAKDPLDVNYEKLQTDLEVLAKDSEEFSMIDDYVKNTHAETHTQYELNVVEVFKVNRHGEADRFQPFKELHNRRLLWHGSRTTNYAGILSQGLRIAPPEAPVTGYMFGKGVYFADMVSKSANYCRTTPSDNIGLLMLCEVALGNMHELTDASYVVKPPKGKHSVKGCGRTGPDPGADITLTDGTIVPSGKGTNTTVPTSSLLYNEYIVYDVAQINIKYLLKLEFKYKYGW